MHKVKNHKSRGASQGWTTCLRPLCSGYSQIQAHYPPVVWQESYHNSTAPPTIIHLLLSYRPHLMPCQATSTNFLFLLSIKALSQLPIHKGRQVTTEANVILFTVVSVMCISIASSSTFTRALETKCISRLWNRKRLYFIRFISSRLLFIRLTTNKKRGLQQFGKN